MHYIDQQRQMAASAAAQAAHNEYVAAIVSAQAAQIATESMGAAGKDGMEYSEETFEFAGSLNPDTWNHLTLPGKYGTALSLVLTARVDTLTVDTSLVVPSENTISWSALRWCVFTAVKDDDWVTVAPPGDTGLRTMQTGTYQGIRLHGPFGNRLALGLGAIVAHNVRSSRDTEVVAPGEYEQLIITIGVQRA
jgi:hypothetical protein